MDKKFNVVFKGETFQGVDRELTKIHLGTLLKLTPDKIPVLFSGKPVILRKNLDIDQATKWKKALEQKGVKVYVLENQTSDEALVGGTKAKPSQQNPKKDNINAISPNGNLDRNSIVRSPKSTKKEKDSGIKFLGQEAKTEDQSEKQSRELPGYYYSEIVLAEKPNFLGFQIDGRYGRLHYMDAVSLVFTIGLIILSIMKGAELVDWMKACLFVFSILPTYFFFRHSALRCHDLNLPAYVALLIFVPYLNILFILALLLVPGTEKMNKYGPPSEEAAIWGIFYFIIVGVAFGYLASQFLGDLF